MAISVDALLQQFQNLTPEQQLKVAAAIDRLTWARRWALICDRISASSQKRPSVSDIEIDELVQSVRREKPLSARSSIRPS